MMQNRMPKVALEAYQLVWGYLGEGWSVGSNEDAAGSFPSFHYHD